MQRSGCCRPCLKILHRARPAPQRRRNRGGGAPERNSRRESVPDETPESLTVAPDLEHSLSGNYARGLLRRGSACVAVLGVPDGHSSDPADNSLTFALLWLTRARHSSNTTA